MRLAPTLHAIRPPGQMRLWSASFLALLISTGAHSIAHFFFFPALPLYFEALGGTESELGAVFAASSTTALVSRPVVAWLTQRWGPKPVYVVGIGLVVVAAAGYYAAVAFLMILLVRMISGLYQALLSTSSSTYVAEIAPANRRGTAFGIYGTVAMLGQLIGGPGALLILELPALRPLSERAASLLGRSPLALNFYSLFFISAVIGLFGLLITRWMRPTPARGTGRLHPRAIWHDVFERRALFPAAVNAGMSLSLIAVYAFLPLMARRENLGNFGFYFTVSALALILVRFIAGPVSDRQGRVQVLVPGLLLSTIGIAMLGFTTNLAVLLISAVLWGAGNGAAQPALTAYLVDRVPPAARGPAMGTYTLGNDLGLGLGATVLGFVLERTNFTVTFSLAAAVSLLSLLVFLAGHRLRWSGALGQPAAEAVT